MADEDRGYESFEGFLRTAIKSYWESSGRSKINFLALLLASREAWQVAWGEATSSPRRLMTGAAGAAAVTALLRAVVSGPMGIVLTGASFASLVAVYVRNHDRIRAQAERYRQLVERYRSRYDHVRVQYVDGRLDRSQRDLMLDGLVRRLLAELDEAPESSQPAPPPADRLDEDLASHIARKRAREAGSRSDGHGGNGGGQPH